MGLENISFCIDNNLKIELIKNMAIRNWEKFYREKKAPTKPVILLSS